jgi:cation:H+ antiporter
VGSNIANIGLVLGVAALVRPFSTEPKMFDRDGFILVATAAAFFALVLDNRFDRLDGAVFVVVYVAYSAFAVRTDREGVEHRFKDFLKFVFDFEYAAPMARSLTRRAAKGAKRPEGAEGARGTAEADGGRDATAGARDMRGVGRELTVIVVALAAVVGGARFAVSEAVWVADLVGVPENLIGLSLIAVGTSLPELLVAITAARRGNAEMVVGNVLGSNIANVLLILGVASLVRPLDVAERSVVYTIPIMLFFSIALLYFIRSDWRVGRGQGALALVAYLGFLVAAFLQGWG